MKREEGKVKREKGRVAYIAEPNSSLLTFPSSLISRFTQILKYQLHLPSGESARSTLVAYALKGREQSVGGGDVLVQQAQGRGARCTGEVELGKLAFGEGGEGPLPRLSQGEELADIVGIHNGYSYRFSIYLNWLLSRKSLPPPRRSIIITLCSSPLKGDSSF